MALETYLWLLHAGETEVRCAARGWRLAVSVGGKAFSPSVSIPSFWAYIYVPPSQWRPPKICSGSQWSKREEVIIRLVHNGLHHQSSALGTASHYLMVTVDVIQI